MRRHHLPTDSAQRDRVQRPPQLCEVIGADPNGSCPQLALTFGGVRAALKAYAASCDKAVSEMEQSLADNPERAEIAKKVSIYLSKVN
jgi:hypothetical protein